MGTSVLWNTKWWVNWLQGVQPLS